LYDLPVVRWTFFVINVGVVGVMHDAILS
jgi:hypothetical protein